MWGMPKIPAVLTFLCVLCGRKSCTKLHTKGGGADSDDVNSPFRGDVNNFGAVATLAFTMMPKLFT